MLRTRTCISNFKKIIPPQKNQKWTNKKNPKSEKFTIVSTTMSIKWLKSKQVKKNAHSGPSSGSASLWTCAQVCVLHRLALSTNTIYQQKHYRTLKPYAMKNSCCACTLDAVWAPQSCGLGKWLSLVEKWSSYENWSRIQSALALR